jgi:hypothetical protein
MASGEERLGVRRAGHFAVCANRIESWRGDCFIYGYTLIPTTWGTFECVRQVRAASLSEADRATILGGQAAAVLPGYIERRPAAAR